MLRTHLATTLFLCAATSAAYAEDISTHVLNIATGQGGGNVPVTLEVEKDGAWTELASAMTQDNGRVEGFGIEVEDVVYRLTFDMTEYDAFDAEPFFPEMIVTFNVTDVERHHHVPVLVSPFGYSTYLGN